MKTNLEVLALRGQATFDTIVTFSPDGETCVAGGWEGFLRVWTVKDLSTESAESREGRRKAWYEVQASEALSARNGFGARHHLDRLVKLEPGRWEHLHARGQAFAELGEWASAVVDYDAALAHPDCAQSAYAERALLYLRAGDAAGYRRMCQQMLERFPKDNSWQSAHQLARICLLTA